MGNPTEFDEIAGEYSALVRDSLGALGGELDYYPRHKARYISKLIGNKRSPKILDFGCGIGNLSMSMRAEIGSAEVHGYDVSAVSLEQLPQALLTAGTFTTDLRQLDTDYDVVVIANVLHHVQIEDRLDVLSDATSRLAANGKLLVFEHNPANPLTRRVVDRCPIDRDAILLKPAETTRYFRQLNLVNVRQDYILFFPPALRAISMLEAYLDWCPLGAQYAVAGCLQ